MNPQVAQDEEPFTQFVSNFPAPPEHPPTEAVAEILCRLKDVVRVALYHRCMWERSPKLFGYEDAESWAFVFCNAPDAPIPDVVNDAYVYLFHSRLNSLRANVLAGCGIEGLVREMVRQFLHRRQRRTDPDGAGVYANVRAAAQQAREAEELESRCDFPHPDAPLWVPDLAPPNHSITTPEHITEVIRREEPLVLPLPELARPSEPAQSELAPILPEIGRRAERSFSIRVLVAAIAPLVREAVGRVCVGAGLEGVDPIYSPIAAPCDREENLRRLGRLRDAIPVSGYYAPVRARLTLIVDHLIAETEAGHELPQTQVGLAQQLDLGEQQMSEDIGRLSDLACDLGLSN